MSTIQARRMALSALFTIPGLALSSWVVRTPAIRDELHASTAEMGMVLLGLSIGSIVGVVGGGPFVAWRGARSAALGGLLSVAASLAVIAAAAATGSLSTAAAGLCLFGVGMGSAEVAVNVEGADVERALERPVLVLLHGCFSLGTLIGATLGLALTALGWSVVMHLTLLSVIAFCVVLVAIRSVPAGTGRRSTDTHSEIQRAGSPGGRARPNWVDRRGAPRVFDGYLVAVSAIALSVALAEGSATDWLPLMMVDDYDFGATSGSAIYLLFALCMTVGRLSSAAILRRWSKILVLELGIVTGAVGVLGITLVDNRWVVLAAIIFWGLGTSLSFPVALSAAADHSSNSAARVAVVSMAGYLSLLVGPPLLGLVGEHVGLRRAMVVPLIALVGAAVIAHWLRSANRAAVVRDKAALPMPVE